MLSTSKDKYVRSVLKSLQGSKEKHTLDAGYNGSETGLTDVQAADKGERTGSNVSVDFFQKDEDGSSAAPEVLLGHELFHSFDYQEGNMKGESKISSSSKDPAEIRAVNFDSRIRNAKGDKKLRDSYGGQKIDKKKLEDPKKPKSL